MSNPKKKTPLQEAIAFWTERYKEAKQAGAMKTMEAADLFLQYLNAMLPKEKQFAEEMFEAGDRRGYSLNSKIDNDTKESIPTFTELYKQYEP